VDKPAAWTASSASIAALGPTGSPAGRNARAK
jgi:hypothetical protein